MFFIFLSCTILLPVISGWGTVFEKYFGKIHGGFSSKLMSGILLITMVAVLISFFRRIDIYFEITTVLIGCYFFYRDKVYQHFFLFFKNCGVSFYAFFLFILISASAAPFILDHFGYYIPTINWITEAGTVKGIASLDLVLGQMSFWHYFQAAFGHFSDVFFRINSFLLLVYLIYIYEQKRFIHLFFIPLFLLFCQSPSPDLPVFIFSLIIMDLILHDTLSNSHLIFAYSIFLIGIKPPVFWLPLFVLLYFIFVKKQKIPVFVPGIFLGIIYLFKNIYCFGFPFFPAAFLDLNFPWQPSPQILHSSADLALLKTFDMQFSLQQIQKFHFTAKVIAWFTLPGVKGVINSLLAVFFVSFFVYTLRKAKKIYWFLFFALSIKLIFVLKFSAQYRFFIDVFIIIFFVIFHQFKSQKKYIAVPAILTLISSLIICFPSILSEAVPSFRPGGFMKNFTVSQLLKPARSTYQKFNSYQIGNLQFNCVKDYPYSFDTALPSITPYSLYQYYQAGVFPQLFETENISSGFCQKKLNTTELETLRKILIENGYSHP